MKTTNSNYAHALANLEDGSATIERVEVNQRALIDKILVRRDYAENFFLLFSFHRHRLTLLSGHRPVMLPPMLRIESSYKIATMLMPLLQKSTSQRQLRQKVMF
jgi:hypothetical protein